MKSNQQHTKIIKSSNLCAEINLISTASEYAVCNLASLCLPTILEAQTREMVHENGIPENAEVIIYGSESCASCHLAAADLKSFGIPFRKANYEETQRYLIEEEDKL